MFKLNKIFFDEPDKRTIIINQLKLFTETDDIVSLVTNIKPILNTMSQHQKEIFLKEIKKFIPENKHSRFDQLIVTNDDTQKQNVKLGQNIKKESNNNIYLNDATLNQFSLKIPQGIRRICVDRRENENFGFLLRGDKPVYVESVAKNSPADRAGIHANDIILAINDIEVEDYDKDSVVNFFRSITNSSPKTNIDVIQRIDYQNYLTHKINELKKAKSKERIFIRPKEQIYVEEDLVDNKNYNSVSFKQKVKQVLNSSEKTALKKILLRYNNTK